MPAALVIGHAACENVGRQFQPVASTRSATDCTHAAMNLALGRFSVRWNQ